MRKKDGLTRLNTLRQAMKRYQWSEPTSHEEMSRRAGGRRRYNAQRQFKALRRRSQLLDVLQRCGWSQVQAARLLGVSESTISRDLAAIDGGRGLARAMRRR
jgi:DNA-binding NarL/FixJ family response regulator